MALEGNISTVAEAEVFLRGQQQAAEGTAISLNDLHDRVHWTGTKLEVSGTRCLGEHQLDVADSASFPVTLLPLGVWARNRVRWAHASWAALGS